MQHRVAGNILYDSGKQLLSYKPGWRCKGSPTSAAVLGGLCSLLEQARAETLLQVLFDQYRGRVLV